MTIPFKISHSDVLLVANTLVKSELSKKFLNTNEHLEKGIYPTGLYIIELSKNEIELVLNWLSDLLIKSGFWEKNELNNIGQQVENLIGIFSAYYDSLS